MKRNILLLASALTAMLLTTSCSKRVHDSVKKGDNTEQTIIDGVTAASGNGTGASDNTSSNKNDSKKNAGPQAASAKTVAAVNDNRCGLNQITGKMSLSLRYGEKSVGVSGNIKMKRNDVIQLSLQFLGMMEIGRVEMTQDYMLILNRHGKQYMKASYADIPYFKQNGISFYTFQSLFWNELFCLGGNDKAPTAKSFTEEQKDENILLCNESKQVALQFLVSVLSGALQQTTIAPTNSPTTLQWNYNEWTNVSNKSFPSNMTLKANYKSTAIEANFKLSRLRTDEKWTDTRTSFDEKKYQQITLQQALSMIANLSI